LLLITLYTITIATLYEESFPSLGCSSLLQTCTDSLQLGRACPLAAKFQWQALEENPVSGVPHSYIFCCELQQTMFAEREQEFATVVSSGYFQVDSQFTLEFFALTTFLHFQGMSLLIIVEISVWSCKASAPCEACHFSVKSVNLLWCRTSYESGSLTISGVRCLSLMMP
jgi:hypothetical protein